MNPEGIPDPQKEVGRVLSPEILEEITKRTIKERKRYRRTINIEYIIRSIIYKYPEISPDKYHAAIEEVAANLSVYLKASASQTPKNKSQVPEKRDWLREHERRQDER